MSVTLYYGPMFSGKTKKIIEVIDRYKFKKKENNKKYNLCAIKSSYDTRNKDMEIDSHDNGSSSIICNFKVKKLMSIWNIVKIKYDVVVIDEGQFFEDIVQFPDLCANNGKDVFIAALDGDYKRNPFGNICKLIPKCENAIKLNAECGECGKAKASFTGKKIIKTTEEIKKECVVEIGGKDIYTSLCRKCYSSLKNKNIIY
jgi:thymidine kinase